LVETAVGEHCFSATVRPVVIVSHGAVAARVVEVDDHPNGQLIWLAKVDLGGGEKVQVVFGGQLRIEPGDIVPAAPPGARIVITDANHVTPSMRKMRSRRYRGERSHGMLCSLDELGWSIGGPDQVAVLRGLEPGQCLHEIPVDERAKYVDQPDILQLADVETAQDPSQRVTK
jgi:tRNA-binding EMAP/Myf-like protein